jgi:hypothetical protein
VIVVSLEHKLSLTLEECAALKGFKICALRSAIWSGELAYIKQGDSPKGGHGRYVICRATLEKFLAAQERRAAS